MAEDGRRTWLCGDDDRQCHVADVVVGYTRVQSRDRRVHIFVVVVAAARQFQHSFNLFHVATRTIISCRPSTRLNPVQSRSRISDGGAAQVSARGAAAARSGRVEADLERREGRRPTAQVGGVDVAEMATAKPRRPEAGWR